MATTIKEELKTFDRKLDTLLQRSQTYSPEKLMTATDFCILYKITKRTLWNWIDRGLVKCVKVGTRRRYIVADSVQVNAKYQRDV